MKKNKTLINLTLLVFLILCCTSLSHAQLDETWTDEDLKFSDEQHINLSEDPVKDPHEGFNRKMYSVNHALMKYIGNPVSKVYTTLIPQKAQKSINNFFDLSQTPSRFFNCLFQKKFKESGIEVSRLLINSTLGLGGLFDPADHFFHLQQTDEDFGQTLGHWGMDEGRYLMLPAFGPATTREVLGFVGNTAFNPFFWLGIYDVHPEDGFRAISITRRVHNYSYRVKGTFEAITEDAIDPYVALRHAYIQLRRTETAK